MNLENVILSSLVFNDDYIRKVLPYVREEYFKNDSDRLIFSIVNSHFQTYNKSPTKEALKVELDAVNIRQDIYDSSYELINTMSSDSSELEWLINKTEEFCKNRAIEIALLKSVEIHDGEHKTLSKESIPQILSEALAVSFDNSIGHDFFSDIEARFNYYHTDEVKIPFDIEYLNKITRGGTPLKTLNMILAGTGIGKTLAMCHFAAANLMGGKNVLYITAEMAEEKIAERIDANLMDEPLENLETMPRDVYFAKLQRQQSKTAGKLIIKEYPTSSVNAMHIANLVKELKLKKNFTPDIIYVDYLNICSSVRFKPGANVNSYTMVKAIAEEMRGLAVGLNVPIWSATQVTRSGYDSSDIELTDTSESFGLPATADFMIGLVTSDDLEQSGQIMVKQLKNRYASLDKFKRFVIGIDRSRMKLFDVESNAQDDIIDDSPVFERGTFGENVKLENQSTLSGFNI